MENKFEFGEWVLVDRLVRGQFIQESGDKYTIDINGKWIDYEPERVTKFENRLV